MRKIKNQEKSLKTKKTDNGKSRTKPQRLTNFFKGPSYLASWYPWRGNNIDMYKGYECK